MSNELALFLVLSLIYVTDCLLWVGKYSVAFVTWGGRQWRDVEAGRVIPTSEGGILLLNPLPPLGEAVCCHLTPVSVSPAGVCSLNCQVLTHSQHPLRNVVSVPFEQVTSLSVDGRHILMNEKRFCQCKDTRQAESLSGLIASLLNAIVGERAAIIQRFWDKQFDYKAAKARFERAVQNMAHLKVLCNILFVHLFVLAPILVLYLGMTGMLIPLAVVMFVIAICISVQFYTLHKSTYLDASEDRIENAIKMVLFPPASLRACDIITGDLLHNYNPVVVGHILLSPKEYKEFSTRTLRNLTYPLFEDSSDKYANEISGWQNRTLSKKISDYLREVANLKEDPLLPPLPNDPGVRSYCPRCLSQFMREEGDCPDCPGVRLLRFDGAVLPPNSSE